MCLAIPMRLVERGEISGTAELRGVRRTVGLLLCPEARAGDHVLVHAGCAISTVDERSARETLELLDRIADADPAQEASP